jgi:hypothetical protein
MQPRETGGLHYRSLTNLTPIQQGPVSLPAHLRASMQYLSLQPDQESHVIESLARHVEAVESTMHGRCSLVPMLGVGYSHAQRIVVVRCRVVAY